MKDFFAGFEKLAKKEDALSNKDVEKIQNRIGGSALGGLVGGLSGGMLAQVFGKKLTSSAEGWGKGSLPTLLPKDEISSIPIGKDYTSVREFASDARKKGVVPLFRESRESALKELSEMKDLASSFMEKHNLAEKGVVIKSDPRGKAMGPHYNPVSNRVRISTTSPAIALHELGHAADYGGTGGLAKAIASRIGGAAVLGAVPASLIYGDVIKKKIEGTTDDKIIDAISAHPYLTAAGGTSLATLYPEGKASFLALKHMADMRGKEQAIKALKKSLGPAYGTYLAATLLPAFGAVGGIQLVSKLRDKKKAPGEKVAARKHVALEAFLGAGIPTGVTLGLLAGSRSGQEMTKAQETVDQKKNEAAYGKRLGRVMTAPTKSLHEWQRNHPVATGVIGGTALGGLAALGAYAAKDADIIRRIVR